MGDAQFRRNLLKPGATKDAELDGSFVVILVLYSLKHQSSADFSPDYFKVLGKEPLLVSCFASALLGHLLTTDSGQYRHLPFIQCAACVQRDPITGAVSS